MEFTTGDTVEVGLEVDKITGLVTRIYCDKGKKPYKIEIRRSNGVCNEYLADSKMGFDYIKKVEV